MEVTIHTPYQLPELRGVNVTIIDLKAKDQNEKNHLVEIQIAHMDGFHKRVLYYASKSYSSQIRRGDDYENLMPTLFIGILDFTATQSKNFINRHIVKNAEMGEHFITDIEFNFIELPKFNKQADELNSIVDQWIYFIKVRSVMIKRNHRSRWTEIPRLHQNARLFSRLLETDC